MRHRKKVVDLLGQCVAPWGRRPPLTVPAVWVVDLVVFLGVVVIVWVVDVVVIVVPYALEMLIGQPAIADEVYLELSHDADRVQAQRPFCIVSSSFFDL